MLRLAISSSSLSSALHPGLRIVPHIRNSLPDFSFFSLPFWEVLVFTSSVIYIAG